MEDRRKSVLFSVILLACINCSYGCSVQGTIGGTIFISPNPFRDVDRGTIIDTGTTNILDIQSISYGGDLNGGSYVDISFVNNRVLFVTNNNYENYEEIETTSTISADVTFICSPGSPQSTLTVTFRIDVQDTNNNAPQFIPSSIGFNISTPVPPNFDVTGCGNEIVVRDIDLTTRAVHFTVDNPDFEIESVIPLRPKEFKAVLRTTTLIRSISEPIVLTITATDEDNTGDPPLTTEARVIITDNTDFTMPDELVFSRTFYHHNYDTTNNDIVPTHPIYLQSGFDDEVRFYLYGELSDYFKLDTQGETATIMLDTVLPDDVLSKKYIFFEVRAEREDTAGAASTVIIKLPEARELRFEESSYRGSIQNNDIALRDIQLAVGYDENIEFDLSGEFSNYFILTDEKNSKLTLHVKPTIPENVILNNNLIYLTVTASGPNAITTTTSILLDIIKDDLSTPVFSRNIYYGTYLGDSIDIQNINLIQGFDKNLVSFKLDGEHSEYFEILGEDNNLELSLRSQNIPEDVIFNEKVLVFNILAEKALTVGGHAAIVIRFSSDLTDTAVMRFSQNTYIGKYESNELKLDNVILSSGYAPTTEFILTGEYETYFKKLETENTVSLSLDKDLPTDTIEDSFIVLEIEARRERAASVWTSVVIDIVKHEIVPPVFTKAYYTGVYNANTGLRFDEVISLLSGFDETTTFDLEGELSNLFELVPSSSTNSFTIDTKDTLSAEILTEHSNLLFTVLAKKPGVTDAHSVIVIDIEKYNPEASTIGFERVSYVGSLQNNAVDLIPITLIEGYTDDAVFALYGELAEYFRVPNEGPEVNLQLPSPIPAHLIPESGIIVLDIRASVPETGTAYATIVLEVVTEDDGNSVVQLQFDATFYTGSYGASGLSVRTPIVLSEGFEDGVQFNLEGDDSQWFNVVPDQNKATLIVGNGIPEAVLLSKQQLVFAITAQKPGSITARATIVISLTDEYPHISTIGFERVSYVGSLQNNAVDLIPITLIEGYTDDAVFALYGELAEYFRVPNEGPEVNLQLPSPIPAHLIPENGIIVLDIRASVPETGTAYATIVLEVVTEDDGNSMVQLQFDATFYTGSYGASGLSVRTPIILSEGFEDGVQFNLEGDDSQWFNVIPDQNKATLIVGNGIPEAVLLSKQQLVFAITAQKPGSITARATIVISLTDEYPPISTIGFERVSYVGSLQNNAVDLIPITLIEGYTDDAVFALYGELAEYFRVPNEGPEVNLQLPSPIPAHLIPESGIIVLDIRASVPETGTAYATIVLEVVTEDDGNSVVQLQFDATFYTGSYGASGLSVRTPIVLSEGFEVGVQFNLEGDDSQWFNVVPDQNKATLIVGNGIPEAVLLSKQQLVFAITAQKPGSITARATIVISLTDEYPHISTIGFERVSYVGSLQNNAVDLIPITLIEGYTDDAVFALYGELAEYFRVPNEGPEVNLQLPSPIPAHLIPESGIIVLDIRASVPETGTAYATIVLEVVTEDDGNSMVQLQFDATFYTGSYGASGLSVRTPIILSEGFEDGVQFNLEGDDSQWFNVIPDQNKATLIVGNGIPEAVLLSKQQLVFAITAQKPGSITARATIVISLTDEYPPISTIGFERVSYVGSLQNNAVDLIPITLIEGYTDDAVFALYGELAEYFRVPNEGPEVNLQLPSPIPAHLIPESGIIVLDIRASVPETGTAYATIVLEVVTEDDGNSVVQLQFDATFYTGSYGASGLSVRTPIVLSEGFEVGVQFNLEGDDSQWFNVVPDQNKATLIVGNGIPEAVLLSKQQLVFAITAQKPGSITARATIVISLTDEYPPISTIGFERVSYVGSLQNNAVDLIPITLIEGYTDDAVFALYGELAEYFRVPNEGPEVNLQLPSPIPAHLIPESGIIVLDIRASVPETGTAYATIVLEVVTEDDGNSMVQLQFDATFYTGSYGASGLSVRTPIILSEGFEDGVQFNLEGDDSQWFNVIPDQNEATLIVGNGIPEAVLLSKQQLVFAITAQKLGSITARATIVISLTDEYPPISTIGFERVSYVGSLQNNAVDLIPITLIEGYTDDAVYALYGELAEYFRVPNEGPEVNLQLPSPIPAHLIPESGIIVLDIRASVPETGTAYATIVLEVVTEDDGNSVVQLQFDATFYTGSYGASGFSVRTPIVLSEGFEVGVQFNLEGDDSQWFNVVPDQNKAILIVGNGIPEAVLLIKQQLVFAITAQKPGSITARATIVISLTDEYPPTSTIGFERVSYVGSLQNNAVDLIPITLIEGYTDDAVFALYGELAEYFRVPNEGPEVNLQLPSPIPAHLIPESGIIVLDIRASVPETGTAYATIVLEAVTEDDGNSVVQLQFDATFYTGSYGASGLSVRTPIILSEGFEDGVQFNLEGDDSQWFNVIPDQNKATLIVGNGIPEAVLLSNQPLVFAITAQRPGSITARATIVISVTDDLPIGEHLSFEKVLYRGSIELGEVKHEDIIIPGFDGTTVLIIGEYSDLLMATALDGVVTVTPRGSLNLPAYVTRLDLELRAATARAVLLLNIKGTDPEVPGPPPTVTFTSESYAVTVEIVQTGIVGRVVATTDNEEALTYSLANVNLHLQSRLSINNEGELFLSAPANSGVYTFQVIATTVITEATGTATVHLTVHAAMVCGGDIVVPPLITLDRDEEEPHNDLVVHEPNHVGCHYVLTNQFPADQDWLYVDENGLHARRIDREHTSIAFMALSQVQVELVLHCESDNHVRTKRSQRTDWLGPYDYGTKNWILTNSIRYNSRRSLVNLIVNDINDNDPIFVGKEHEPIAVGFPIDELKERILPRSLVELKATDADIGLNAELRYWSSESALAVAPTTGFVHVQSSVQLENNQILTVHATDRKGEGNTGSIQLVVKLLTANNIAVVTVRNAFLDDEANILEQLSEAVGYDVKALRSVVISEDTEPSRQSQGTGVSLQLYVYGVINREPVAVDRLTENINNNSEIVNAISSVSLEDHLEDSEIQQHYIGLLVATILLSILLFILILLIAIWYFLRWRKNRNYDQFSDNKSIVSSNESLGDLSKPAENEPVNLQPRLNIEDLKRSERRLQEMLDTPIEEVTVEPVPSTAEPVPFEAILDISMPEINVPIVIQSIDKLKDAEDSGDEFGEINKTPRKSVVTFNENVEKIIHVEDDTDNSSQSGYEIYKF